MVFFTISWRYGNPFLLYLPGPVKWFIARIAFYPTLLMHLARNWYWPDLYPWWHRIDPNIILGGLPFSSDVPKLAQEKIIGVINCCEEYEGPVNDYKKYGIQQLRIPVIDYFPPSMEQIHFSIDFISDHCSEGSIYLHCKAGRGRSACVAICWLMKKYNLNPEQAQEQLLAKRPVVSKRLSQLQIVKDYFDSLQKNN